MAEIEDRLDDLAFEEMIDHLEDMEGDSEEVRRRKKSHRARRSHKREELNEEDLTTVDQLYEMIMVLRTHMSVREFADIILLAFEVGLLKCYPTTGEPMMVMTPARVVIMADAIAINLDASIEDLVKCMSEVKETEKIWEVLANEKYGEILSQVGHKVFVRFIDVLSEFLRVEKQVLVSHIVWAQKKHFELADSQYELLNQMVKEARPREHADGILRLDGSDVLVLMRAADCIAPCGSAEGITSEKCNSLFVKFLKNVEELMKERVASLMDLRTGLTPHDHFTPHRHELRGGSSLVGRTEFSLFLYELWIDPSNHLQSKFINPSIMAAALSKWPVKEDPWTLKEYAVVTRQSVPRTTQSEEPKKKS